MKELGGAGRPIDIRPLVIKKLEISEAETNETLQSGIPRVANQIDWARNYLREEDLLSGKERGIWRLTEKGMKTNLSDDEVYKIFKTVQKKYQKKNNQSDEDNNIKIKESEPSDKVPLENQHQVELLDIIYDLSPYGFEKLCKRLLIEEGFQNVQVTQQTRDGGIDGIAKLSINRFVSFRVFFQCKKIKGSVGSETIQKFKGALDGKTKAGDKGLIITTGYFTDSAEKEATIPGGFPVELIDGEKLVEMFETLNLGLKPKTVYDINHEFFAEFK